MQGIWQSKQGHFKRLVNLLHSQVKHMTEVLHLDVLPVQKVAQLQSSAQHHGGHISDDLHQRHAALK